MNTGKIAGYYTADGESSFTGPWRERFANSFFAGRSGDVMLSYPAHHDETVDVVAAGSVYNYDTRVPLIFYGPMFRARTIEDTVAAIDVAPTLARSFGLSLPPSATGRVLGEAISPPVKAAR
jgi:arylsulfatase A-like enzyme